MGHPRVPQHCTHRRLAPGLYEPIVEGKRLHDGGVSLGALLKLLQRQLPIRVLQNTPVQHHLALVRGIPGPSIPDLSTPGPWHHTMDPGHPTQVPITTAASVSLSSHQCPQPGRSTTEGAMPHWGPGYPRYRDPVFSLQQQLRPCIAKGRRHMQELRCSKGGPQLVPKSLDCRGKNTQASSPCPSWQKSDPLSSPVCSPPQEAPLCFPVAARWDLVTHRSVPSLDGVSRQVDVFSSPKSPTSGRAQRIITGTRAILSSQIQALLWPPWP